MLGGAHAPEIDEPTMTSNFLTVHAFIIHFIPFLSPALALALPESSARIVHVIH